MLKQVALIFGLIFLVIGILGFVPELNKGGKFMGIFTLNDMHNYVHIATGVVGILCGLIGNAASQVFFKVFGVVYAIVAALGFYYGDSNILGMISSSMPNTWLHVGAAAISLFFGFVWKK